MFLSANIDSAVWAAIVSGVVSYIISKRQGKLQYIIAERKEWREKIRMVAQELEGASYENTLKVLTELKVRINSFGNNGVLKDYGSDAHIWKVIHELEERKIRGKELESKQKQLIEYISLLLKSDWERSKKEVKGDIYSVLSGVFFLITAVSFCVSLFYYSKKVESVSVIMIIGIYALMMIATHILLCYENKITYRSILNGMITSDPKQYSSCRLIGCYVICLIGAIVLTVIFGLLVWGAFTEMKCGKYFYLSAMVIVILYMFGLGFQVASRYLYIDNQYHYVNAINKIRANYEKNDELLGDRCKMGKCKSTKKYIGKQNKV